MSRRKQAQTYLMEAVTSKYESPRDRFEPREEYGWSRLRKSEAGVEYTGGQRRLILEHG